jgi:hypothetical protein
MIPASAGPFWFLAILGVVMLGILVIFAGFAYSSRHTTFEIGGKGLQIKGTLYGRTIPGSSLIPDQAKVVDMTRERGFSLGWRTNGAGLPGYAAGWFRLKNKQKVLAFVTDQKRTVYLPTTEGFAVVMSVPNPEEFLERLRGLTAGTGI